MPKKKKTRKQKEQSDVRRQSEPVVSFHTPAFKTQQHVRKEQDDSSTPLTSSPIKSSAAYRVSTTDYHYLSGDLRKTLIITAVIIGLEVLLKFGTGI